jgi:hypothetical protein
MNCFLLSRNFFSIIFLCYAYCTELNNARGEESYSAGNNNSGLTFSRNGEVESLKAAVGIDSAEKALIYKNENERMIALEAVVVL